MKGWGIDAPLPSAGLPTWSGLQTLCSDEQMHFQGPIKPSHTPEC